MAVCVVKAASKGQSICTNLSLPSSYQQPNKQLKERSYQHQFTRLEQYWQETSCSRKTSLFVIRNVVLSVVVCNTIAFFVCSIVASTPETAPSSVIICCPLFECPIQNTSSYTTIQLTYSCSRLASENKIHNRHTLLDP